MHLIYGVTLWKAALSNCPLIHSSFLTKSRFTIEHEFTILFIKCTKTSLIASTQIATNQTHQINGIQFEKNPALEQMSRACYDWDGKRQHKRIGLIGRETQI